MRKSPRVCAWPGCPASDVFVSVVEPGEALVWHCLTHVDDDFLPPVAAGVWGNCAACGEGCVTWVEATPVHSRCRRRWASGAVKKRPLGAYARRRT